MNVGSITTVGIGTFVSKTLSILIVYLSSISVGVTVHVYLTVCLDKNASISSVSPALI